MSWINEHTYYDIRVWEALIFIRSPSLWCKELHRHITATGL